ncbi:TPA: hypothetical protein PXQ89_000757 [Yersinia enterocolitica]|nr:hypothetical protein [Yersinia enterocolitica]
MRPLMPPVQTPDNLFHDGDPSTGDLGTIVEAEHLNNEQAAIRDVQAELISVLTAAGLETNPDAFQLVLALEALFAAKSDTLGALSSLVGAADKLPYFTGPSAATLTNLTSVGRSVISQTSIANLLTYLGLGDISSGRLIKTTPFATTQPFHAQAATKFVRVRLVAGGAASGAASATGAAQNCVTCPGGLGVYAEALFFANFDGVLVTIGTGGLPRLGTGFNGGDSSFGSLLVCQGGIGSLVGNAVAPPGYTSPQGLTLAPTIDPAGLLLCSEYGQTVNPAIIAALGVATNYHQIYRTKLGNSGIGGSGQLRTVNASQQVGVAGFDGFGIVEEYA